jgi:putative membrane protein insertion efficiency factor
LPISQKKVEEFNSKDGSQLITFQTVLKAFVVVGQFPSKLEKPSCEIALEGGVVKLLEHESKLSPMLTSTSLFGQCPHPFTKRSLLPNLGQPSAKRSTLLKRALKTMALFFLSIYKTAFSIHMGGVCRFEPSCSDYAVQCYQTHDFGRATKLTWTRLCRCHPWGEFGYDPVPAMKECE